MQYIGAISNIQFGFTDGLLAGFRIPTHRKAKNELRERFVASQPNEIFEPKYGEEDGLAWSQVTTDGRVYWQASQELGVGCRKLEIQLTQRGEDGDKAGGQSDSLSSTLKLSFVLESPLHWEMAFADVAPIQSDDMFSIQLKQRDNVNIIITATCPLHLRSTSEGSQLTMVTAFLNAKAQINLEIMSQPYFRVADTVVICRPSQLREAAVVLSCLPSGYLTPLIIADEPPVTEREYMSKYEQFKDMTDQSMQNVVGLGPGQAEDKVREALELMQGRWKIQESLTPYRSWIKRNEQFADILARIALKRIVFLFNVCDLDLVTLVPEGRSMTSEDEGRNVTKFIPEGCSVICLLQDSACSPKLSTGLVIEHRYSTLSELTDLAWSILQEKPIPCRSIEVAEEDEEAYPLCLYDALHEQIPLRPQQSLIHKRGLGWVRSREAETLVDEGVLVELTGKARDLIGVLYARFRGAKLLVRPAPELVAVERALSSINEEQLRAAQAYRYVEAQAEHLEASNLSEPQAKNTMQPADGSNNMEYKNSRFLDWVQRFLLGNEHIEQLQSAVTAQIPEYVEREIGDRKLTAFTVGLPYSFLKRGDCDWSEKAIGHVIDDPDLVVLREAFLLTAPRSIFNLSAIFDPGYFSTSETEDVLHSLDAHLTHPLVLDGKFASTAVLQYLCPVKNLEFVFFNTHGSENAVMLDMPLSNYLIVQWLSFKGNPIVFNNSCLSWIGVGREFVRVGARGYVGTLWSVDSKDAATVAATVMSRLVSNRMTVSESLCDVSVATLTRRAYIFVGTCSVALDVWANIGERHKREYVIAGVELFSRILMGIVAAYQRSLQPALKVFHRQLVEFEERLEKICSEAEVELLLNARFNELLVIAHDSNPLEVSNDYEIKVINLCHEYLVRAGLDEGKRRVFEGELRVTEAKIMRRRGKVLEAISKLRAGHAEDIVENGDGRDLLALIDLHKQAGHFDKAIEVGLQVKKLFEKKGDKIGIITAIGQLCQVYRRTGDLEAGLALARTGFSLAAEIGEQRRQPIFKLDESNLLQLQGKLDEAIEAAKLAARLYRIYHQEGGDLRCHGAIGQCYLQKGDLGSARKWLRDGYEYAKKINDIAEIACFAGDLSKLEVLCGDISASAEYSLEALEIFVKMGMFEAIPGVVHGMIAPCIGDSNLLGGMLCYLLAALNGMEPAIAATVVPAICETIKSTCRMEGGTRVQSILNGLSIAFGFGKRIRAEREVTGHFKFMVDVFAVFGNWLGGNMGSAIELARKLDSISNGALSLERLVSNPPSALAP